MKNEMNMHALKYSPTCLSLQLIINSEFSKVLFLLSRKKKKNPNNEREKLKKVLYTSKRKKKEK